MSEIHKKINREYFEAIQNGQKTFEFRVADFDCNPGDITAPIKVVVLSGSLKFYDKMQELHEKLELENGWAIIGVTPHVMQRGFTPEEEDLLDELHRAKIRLADALFVVNVGGYIGKSTRAEIEFAEQLGKEIIYLEKV